MEGVQLASAGDDIKILDCGNGFSLVHAFNPHCNHNIASLSWNNEGSLLASCAQEDDKVVLTYMKNDSLTPFLELQCGAGVQCSDFSSSSRLLLCGGEDNVTVWDLKTKALKKSFKEHKGPVTCARFNANNSYIAAGSETGEIILHNMVTCQSSSPIVAPNIQAIRQLEYSVVKKSMFGTASDDGAITLWDANSRRAVHRFKDAHVGPATGLAFSPINEMLMMSVGLDKRLVCYDIQRKQILKVIDAPSPLTCIDIMPDGATAAVGSTRGTVYMYNLRQGGHVPVHSFQAHKTSVRSVKFMPSAKLQSEDSGGVKASFSATAGNRRQLPPAPTVMQDITPSKTGQTADTEHALHAVSPTKTADIFSPTVQGNQSQNQHSKSASHLNLTNNNTDGSFAGVFSPLIKGAAELSSTSVRDVSLLSLPSFLGQNNSNVHSPVTGRVSFADLSSDIKASSHALFPHSNSQIHFGDKPAQQLHGSPAPVAGDLSHLHQSGTVQSPLVGQLSHPQLCSSLQTSLEAPSHGQANSHLQESQRSPVNRDTRQVAVNGTASGPQVLDLQNRSGLSASPDSAAISGGEDVGSEGGVSPRRDAPHLTNGSTSHAAITASTNAHNNSGSTAAVPVDVVAAGNAGIAQREFLRSLVADAMEDVRDDLHRDIQGLHVAMLRQFFVFERETKSTLSYYADMNQKLMHHNRQLEEENKRLKKNY
ncbi:protein NEDD1-like [Littorina saxatilis]|uniref:Uncharacterized protein n=1 Tax=Littorina saxatilis TaxID=31220 RepID=A0AAN9BBT7_9CAEN